MYCCCLYTFIDESKCECYMCAFVWLFELRGRKTNQNKKKRDEDKIEKKKEKNTEKNRRKTETV